MPVYKTKLAAPTEQLLRSSTPITDTYETFEIKANAVDIKTDTSEIKADTLDIETEPQTSTDVEPQVELEESTSVDDKSSSDKEGDEEKEEEDNQFELTDDDLDEALADLALEDSQNEQIYENDPVKATENHYMPMTARSILSPSHKMIATEMLADENPYVEMTNNLPPNLKKKEDDDDSKSNYEAVCIVANEPVYMELAQGKQPSPQEESHSGKSTLKRKKKKSRKDLPDILKASQTESNDTSDADDEIDTSMSSQKSRSRFSLSDTFRPASYYLGVNSSSTPLSNCIESSDSEIVSPPPIPSTNPPHEVTEEIFSSEHFDTVKRKSSKLNLSFDQIPKIHSSNSSLNSNTKADGHKSSRLSLPDQFMKFKKMNKHERTLSSCSSNTSSDFDLYNKLKNTSPSYQSARESCSENESVEMRHKQGSDSELDRHRSRRPLSEESISEIESMSEQFEEAVTNEDLDAYLHPLQTSDLSLYQNTTTVDILIKPPEIFRNENDEHFYGNIHFVSSTDSIEKVGDKTPIHSRQSSNISTSSVPYYYHELLNRDTPNNQRDIQQPTAEISLIHNPLTSARSFSMEILSEKDQTIDSKNLYTMKPNIEKLSYSTNKNLKTQITGGDGLVNNYKNNQQKFGIQQKNNEGSSSSHKISVAEPAAAGGGEGGEQLWEEDSLWRESLRRVSQRHARSLDDLDRIDSNPPKASKLTRDVTYVNDNIVNRRGRMASPLMAALTTASKSMALSTKTMAASNVTASKTIAPPIKVIAPPTDENDVYVQLAETNVVSSTDVYECLREDYRKSVEIDRETIRQWDSMSSGLMRNTSISGVKSSVNSQLSLKSTNYLREISGNEAIKPTAAQHSTNEKKADISSYSIKF